MRHAALAPGPAFVLALVRWEVNAGAQAGDDDDGIDLIRQEPEPAA
jgi:hypothetical protein